jgi:hypothetical protein
LAGINRFAILTDMGDTDAVVTELPELLRITAAAGLTSAVGVCEMLLATSAGRRGQPRDAVQRAERAIERIKRGGQSEQAVGPSVGLIELLILDGRHSEALALADRNLETAESLGPGHARPLALQRLRAMALTGLGDVATARSLLVDVCRRADETGILHERCFARWAIAQLPDGGLQIEEQRVLTKLETELTPTSAVLYRTAWMASERSQPERAPAAPASRLRRA